MNNQKYTDNFKLAIQMKLNEIASRDQGFYTKYNNPKKNIDDCITYILNTVQKSGVQGFTDEEVYGMAIHYYDEEKIDVGNPITAHVVVNHKIELTEEDIKEAKERAMREAVAEQKAKLAKPKAPAPVKKEEPSAPIQSSLF